MGDSQDRPSSGRLPGKDDGYAVRHHDGKRTPGGHHSVGSGTLGAGRGRRVAHARIADKGNRIAVDLVHVLKPACPQACFSLQEFPPAKDVGRIVPYVQGQVSGPGVSECHPDAGPDFGSPPKQSKHR
jgi:hypothetical protein